MWIEVILSRDDLVRLLVEAFPFTVHLNGATAEHSLSLTDLGEVTLVSDVGLRVVCKARVRWPVLGIDVPVAVNSLTLLLLPTIGHTDAGEETLAFRASIEHADFAGLPSLVDSGITAAINAKLAAKAAALSWKFTKALTYVARLPAMLEPLQSFAIRPAWGKVRITDDAIVYAASFHSALVRRGEPLPDGFTPLASPPPPSTPPGADSILAHRDGRGGQIAAAGIFALALGATYLVVRGALQSRSLFA
jgi:hypothetical protein